MIKCLVTPGSLDGQHVHRFPESSPLLSLIVSGAAFYALSYFSGDGSDLVSSFGSAVLDKVAWWPGSVRGSRGDWYWCGRRECPF